MIDFILEHWRAIFDLVVLLIAVILFIVKKKPVKVIDSVTDFLYKLLPALINKVERPGEGEQKKNEVISLALYFLSQSFPGVDVNQYVSLIEKIIEAYLSTPNKKGE